MAALCTFSPCHLVTVLPGPYFKKYGKLPAFEALVVGITAAAVSAITGSVTVIARVSIVDLPIALLAFATALVLWRSKKLQDPVVVNGFYKAELIYRRTRKTWESVGWQRWSAWPGSNIIDDGIPRLYPARRS